VASSRITKRAVDDARAGPRDAFLWDDEVRGFGLRVTTAGAKSYVFQYRLGGREAKSRRFTIGKHGSPWTPDTARKRAKELAEDVRRGIDPVDSSRERRRQAVDLAFSSYVELFNEAYLEKRWARSSLGHGILKREAVPVLGRKPLPKISRADINAVYDRLVDRPAVARLAHATMRKLFRWALSRGDIDRSPLEGVEAPPAVESRDRVMNDDELALAWQSAEDIGSPFLGFYRLLILTGQRREEVAGLHWAELDRATMTWTLPGERAKNRETHIVPLSELARDVLDAVAGGDKWPRRGLVFSTTGARPVSGFSKAKRRLDEFMLQRARKEAEKLGDDPTKVTIEPWRVHDLRRTFATGLQRLGIRLEVAEACLNHISGSRSGIVGVYQRHNWAEEKRLAMDAWARHVGGLLEPAADRTNVVQLGVARA